MLALGGIPQCIFVANGDYRVIYQVRHTDSRIVRIIPQSFRNRSGRRATESTMLRPMMPMRHNHRRDSSRHAN